MNGPRYFCILWFMLSNKNVLSFWKGAAFYYTICCGPFGIILHNVTATSVAEIKSRGKPKGQASVGVHM